MLAATNRPDVLDSALLRPGRFDRRVTVQAPDRTGRVEILKVHTRAIPLDADVDLDALAASTPGMVGADLANLANEAALLAARRHHKKVEMADFTDSLEKIMLGAPRGMLLSPPTASAPPTTSPGTRSSGMLTPGADPVRKVSIIPRGMALGVTLSTPDTDRVSYSREELHGQDQGRARRPRRRGGRLREDHDRRRVRHPAADDDRAPDGRALGHERRDRADRRVPEEAQGSSCPASARPPRRPSSSSTPRSAGSSRPPTRGHRLLD